METMAIQNVMNGIPQEKHNAFMMEFNSRKKDSTVAVLLAVLLGGIGGHRFYMGDIGLGVLYLLFSWTGIPLIAGLIEAFTISKKVESHNMTVAAQVASMMRGDSSGQFNLS